jgi:hypothetical protein
MKKTCMEALSSFMRTEIDMLKCSSLSFDFKLNMICSPKIIGCLN